MHATCGSTSLGDYSRSEVVSAAVRVREFLKENAAVDIIGEVIKACNAKRVVDKILVVERKKKHPSVQTLVVVCECRVDINLFIKK
jgi:hypothetical protein